MHAINCESCGFVVLSKNQYREQQDSSDYWFCPKCKRAAPFYNVSQPVLDLGCVACKRPILKPTLFSERHWGFFCDRLCLGVYDREIQRATGHLKS